MTAMEMARRGCLVVLACRSMARGTAAKDRMQAAGIDPTLIQVKRLDLSSLKTVRAFASDILADNILSNVTVLILNAGLNAGVFSVTEDGVELSFAVNHLGHFELTRLLMPRLKQNGPSRVVVLSSDSHFDTYEPEGVLLPPESNSADTCQALAALHRNRFSALLAYGQAKLCNALFMAELARRHPITSESSQRVFVNAAHPGLTHSAFYTRIATRLRENKQHVAAWVVGVFDRFLAPIVAYTPATAALTPLHLATAHVIEDRQIHGRYFVPVATQMPMSAHAQNKALPRRLWAVSEQLVGAKFD